MPSLRLLDTTDGPGDPGLLDEVLRQAGLGGRGRRIRCPQCAWQPRRRDRWYCSQPGCGNRWNTFETGGRCPGCGYRWTVTACLSCHCWAPHADWYVGGTSVPHG